MKNEGREMKGRRKERKGSMEEKVLQFAGTKMFFLWYKHLFLLTNTTLMDPNLHKCISTLIYTRTHVPTGEGEESFST